MGEQHVDQHVDSEELRAFVRYVLRDLRALERMLSEGLIESDRVRMGAEQEYFIVDEAWNAKSISEDVLRECAGMDVTPELARFNIEMNTPPFEMGPTTFSGLEAFLDEGNRRLLECAHSHGADLVMTGILPTLQPSDLSLENMYDSPRYNAFDEALKRLRGGGYEFRIKGTDELVMHHDSVMIEACNTSFQIHLQVAPKEFAEVYNIAQLVSAPVLAAATNSPLLFGKRLWRETRLALFQQSMDTRQASSHSRESRPRVAFGDAWVRSSVAEIFREDIARFRVLLAAHIEEDPFEALAAGRAPDLTALRLYNGTVYRWNRPCYGVGGGRAHLRIENRLLPSGPTIRDEVANAAFWIGLIKGMHLAIGDIRPLFEFDDAHSNLVAAARLGLGAYFDWAHARQVPARELILEELLNYAETGLAALGVSESDRRLYLGVIEKRVACGLTGSQWILSSLAAMRKTGSRTERMAALTAGMAKRQQEGTPVHSWSLARIDESGGWKKHYQRVEQYMTTDLFTVNQNEAVDLVACLMDWRHIRHVPVEDDDHKLVGLVSSRILLRLVAQGWTPDSDRPVPVSAVMQRNIVSIPPSTTTKEAIELMKENGVACLPVVDEEQRLIGLVTQYDLVKIASPLLEQALEE